MKKFYHTALLLGSILALSGACNNDNGTEPTPGPQPDPTPDPVQEWGIEMINTTKVLYYGDRKTPGIYNYFFGLCDSEFIQDEQGDDAAPEGGKLVFFDLYSSVGAESFETAELPEGTYTLTEGGQPGTLDPYYTRLQVWQNGKQVRVDFSAGSLEVTNSAKGKLLKAEFTLTDGETLKCYYEGALTFGDPDEGSDEGIPPITEPVDAEFVWGGGIYYGDEYGTGTDRFEISFTQTPVNAEGIMTGAGHNIVLSLYAEPNEAFIALPAGTYQVAGTYAPGTIEPGEFVLSYIGSICAKVDDAGNAVAISPITGGSITVYETSGWSYDIEFNLKTDQGIDIKGRYNGEIELEDQSTPAQESNTTLTGDYKLNLEGATATLTYYGDFYENGTANWILSIEKEQGDAIDIELITAPSSQTALPLPEGGQYNMSVDYGIGVVKGESSPFGMLGTWYIDLSTLDADGYIYGYAAAIEGNIKLSEENGIYNISFEFVDDLYNLFCGQWSGTIPEAENQSGMMQLSTAKTPRQASRFSLAERPARR